LIYKKSKRKIKLLKIVKIKVAQAFLVAAQLGPVHDFDGLARKLVYGLNGPTSLGGRSVL
jgi:hypothetical protein